MIWRIYKKNIYFFYCKLKDYSQLFFKDDENVLGEWKLKILDVIIEAFWALKSKEYAHKIKTKEEIWLRNY